MELKEYIPSSWKEALSKEIEKPYFKELNDKLMDEYKKFNIFPEKKDIFNSISCLNPQDVKVVILGQDPYIKPNQAHGLSFSVKDGVSFPKSLNNIFKELNDDLGCEIPKSGSLEKWAKQGVLLLNTVLTVRENESNSHSKLGWQNITTKILETVMENKQPKVFILWGDDAKKSFISACKNKTAKDILGNIKINSEIYIEDENILVLTAPHPSPLSAYRGFWGSKPFSKTNKFLVDRKVKPIDWSL